MCCIVDNVLCIIYRYVLYCGVLLRAPWDPAVAGPTRQTCFVLYKFSVVSGGLGAFYSGPLGLWAFEPFMFHTVFKVQLC